MTRLFHVSDVHFGREDAAAVAWFDALVKAEKPDAVVMTGDLTMRARRREFAAGLAWLQGLGVPVTVTHEEGRHHFDVIDGLIALNTGLVNAVLGRGTACDFQGSVGPV